MQVSTKLLNQQQVRQFSKINERIADAQERVSTGKNILRASDDPVAAINLSVAKEQSLLLGQFQRNIEAAEKQRKESELKIKEFDDLVAKSKIDAKNILAQAREKVQKDITSKRETLDKQLDEEIKKLKMK